MTAAPLLPRNAPFSPEDIDTLNTVVSRTTAQQRAWLAGFFAGYEAAQGGQQLPQAVAPPKARQPLTVLYGSESGNAEALALKIKKLSQKHGLDARIYDMADADLSVLAKAKNLMVFVSTWGEGDPPGRAVDFYTALMSDAAPRLDKSLRFAVLALGDTAYAQFCAVGRAIDARLEALGATRAADRIDLDLDFAKKAAEWTEGALTKLAPAEVGVSATVVHVDFKGGAQPFDDEEPAFTAEHPLEGEIAALINLNGTGSTRETWHVEIAADAPGFSYAPGDAIGVLPENDPALALELAEAVGLGADGGVVQKLRQSFDVTTLSRNLIEAYAKLTGRSDVAKLADPKAFAEFAADRQLIDLLRDLPREARARTALRPAAAASRAALLGRFEPQRASGRGSPPGRRRALGVARPQARGRCLHVPRRPLPRRRQGAHLRQAEPPLPPARGQRAADRHDRRRHRRRALPRLHRGARRAGRQRQELARVRRAQLHLRLPLPARMAGAPGQRRSLAHRRRLLARPAGEDLRAAAAVGAPRRAAQMDRGRRAHLRLRRREGHGPRRGRYANAHPRRGRAGDEEAGRAKLKELAKAGRYQRDVY